MTRFAQRHWKVVLLALAAGQAGFCQYSLAINFRPLDVEEVTRDRSGAIFAAGFTSDATFPVTSGAYQTQYSHAVCDIDYRGLPVYCQIGFVAKFSPSGE